MNDIYAGGGGRGSEGIFESLGRLLDFCWGCEKNKVPSD